MQAKFCLYCMIGQFLDYSLSLEDANTLIKHFGIRRPTIDYWNWIQRDWCSTTGNNKNDVFFPRYKKEGGRNIYTIREINRFFRLLYDNDRPMYDFLVKNFKAQRKRA